MSTASDVRKKYNVISTIKDPDVPARSYSVLFCAKPYEDNEKGDGITWDRIPPEIVRPVSSCAFSLPESLALVDLVVATTAASGKAASADVNAALTVSYGRSTRGFEIVAHCLAFSCRAWPIRKSTTVQKRFQNIVEACKVRSVACGFI